MFYIFTYCLLALLISNTSCKKVKNPSDINFHFTKSLYNVSIPENSVAKTYASPYPGERMGIQMHKKNAFSDFRYKIISGDRDKFFKAEDRLVGDFVFLFIRTRTGNNHVLNRERKDKYLLEIKAVASYRENKHKVAVETQTVVEVTVLDINDLSPLFYPTDYNITVYEDTPLHRKIVQVTAEDADLGRNGEIYYSFAKETDQFAIHPMTGIITLTRPLLYSETSYHELKVLGQDRSAALLTPKPSNILMMSKATVRIRVRKVNFHAPEINVRKHAKIIENSISDIYAIVTVTDKDTGIHGEIKSLEIVHGDPDGHFRIRPTAQKGEYTIEVLKLLDREKTPEGYSLQLRAVDRGIPPKESYKSVPVLLADLNDNAPVFNKEIYEVKVPETAPVNSPLIRLKVTDADEGKNARVYLEIVGGNEGGEFIVNSETGMLYTAVPLDAENKPFYSLTVSAIDQGNVATRKQSSAKVKVYVVDTNDNDPIFENSEATVWVNENQPAGTSVTTVRAKDLDSGENAYISYLIANIVEVPFEIDHFSGLIKTTMLLDYESMRREYVLRLRASDWGLPYRRQTEMQMVIKVKDINDNRPQFEKIDCSGHLSRYTAIGVEVITLSAIDFDAENIISYRIVSGNDDSCFSIEPTTGTLSVACDLTTVASNEREINVTATDGTHFSDIVRVNIKLTNTNKGIFVPNDRILPADTFECKETGVARRLTEILAASENNNKISIQDEFPMMPSRYGQNIHTPEFIDFPTEIKVNESVTLGTTLIKIKARDRDLGYNGKLVYGISGGDEHSVFSIDMDSGHLKVIGYLDREREYEYFLNITVYDLGNPQKSTSKMLPATILDVNDNPPKFEKSLASFRITENALNGTIIFKANATDLDIGDNAQITYSLITDTNDFTVHKRTGALKVTNELDRERQEVYDLRIRATDGGGKDPAYPRLYSDAIVRIIVDDINDNAPKFSLPNYSVKIHEDVPLGTVLAVVTAFDPDLGEDGKVVYSMDDNGDKTFKIDEVSGTIRTIKHLDYEERQVYNFKVIAKDCGNPPLSSETLVTVNVVDVNENLFSPHFSDFVYSAAVLENQPSGTAIIQVNATDQDPPGEDNRIEYSIKGGDGIGFFSIDNNGIIRSTSVLDIESKTHYWLTVYAQDHGVVPLYSSVEVYIEVLNENDNVPLTEQAVYYPSISEDSSAGQSVVQIIASDNDIDPEQKISFKIISGDPGGVFAINTSTGLITRTSRRLDREIQEEHVLEVLVSDNGNPSLSSTTRVIVKIDDVNDNSPEFEQSFYKVQVSASHLSMQNIQPEVNADGSGNNFVTSEGEQWEISFQSELMGLKPLMRVLAFDKDVGPNGQLQYTIKYTEGKNKFKINNSTGAIYSENNLEPGQVYELNIRATDGGNPPRSSTCRVSLLAVLNENKNGNPPVVKTPSKVEVTENDKAGFLVSLIQATDEDGDVLWYDIVDGDPRNEFYIGSDSGNILLAHQLDRETQGEYKLNISVTDSYNTVFVQLEVTVIDINEHNPEFSKQLYKVEISENVPIGSELLQLQATDKDEDKKLVYSLHSARNAASLKTFKVDSASGRITLLTRLDRETFSEHYLTVEVRDGGTPAKRNYARVLVIVHDHNDHAPVFSEKILVGRIFESTAIGSAVLRAYAVDEDHGDNGRVTYSITGGNVGNVFGIDTETGVIRVTRELDVLSASEYMLYVRATDHGNPALTASIPAHITVAMADNAPPRCVDKEVAAEVFEDKPLGGYVAHLDVKSTSSLQFEIIYGNDNMDFAISPSTGVIVTTNELDYERCKMYNLTVLASNMANAIVNCNVIVHVLDVNDNSPRFLQATYSGFISESSPIDSLVMTNNNIPLVIKATDADSETNALLQYDIIEPLPQKFFSIDANTGALKTVRNLDRETYDHFTFHVQVSDLGKPRLSCDTTAKVYVVVNDVNDCSPEFSQPYYNATVLLPTYKDVIVVQLNATDRDENTNSLKYDIIDGDSDKFSIDSVSGAVTVSNPNNLGPLNRMQVRVSDGKHSSIVKVYVEAIPSESSGLVFQKDVYVGTVVENSTKVSTVLVVNVLGNDLYEHVEFRILNPTDMFEVGLTSGVVRNTGKKFDREVKDRYELIIEATSRVPDSDKARVAHVLANITVLDVNDNCPMFVNLPYYAVVSIDEEKGTVIAKVHAIDMDSLDNGEVRYELIKGHGELFKVRRETGDIELKQSLEGHNREYELIVAAYDKGIPPCRTNVKVHIKVVDRSMPVFKKQFYSEIVAENVELHSPLSVLVQAESPLDRRLIYTIVSGNDQEKFALDFNTGLLSVVDELDFEVKQQYELIIRATDCISGAYAEVPVSIVVQDVNDCYPEFEQESYNVSVSEAAPFGSIIVAVFAKDNDTGVNQKIKYSIINDKYNSTNYFHVDEEEGIIYLKKSLDHEKKKFHHFIVSATDQGVPNLSTIAHVWLTVIDMNDNTPKFEQSSYVAGLSIHARRDQFVTVVKAYDPDIIDQKNLKYGIVSGNELQTFSIHPQKGIVTIINLSNFGDQKSTILNVSVSDGVYTSFTKLKVDLLAANLHSPTFANSIIDVSVPENKPVGHFVAAVTATDEDFGEFGYVTYSIQSQLMEEIFKIDIDSGRITTAKVLDREQQKSYEIPVVASDGGGKLGFATVKVKVLDENDNPPKFYYKEYKASIDANASVDVAFLKIQAYDLDDESGAKIEYSIYDKKLAGISDFISINPKTGELFLTSNAGKLTGRLFQLFVRASNPGKSYLHSDVPVDILIKESNDIAPIFEKKDEKFFLPENSPAGIIITKLKMVSHVRVNYKIISNSKDDLFDVDNNGQLTLTGPLDFESEPTHIIGILAETDSSPPLTSLTEIVLQILDENDNPPIFESNPYIVYVAENIEEGSVILRVIAHDKDQGSNGEVRYSFSSDSEDILNTFTIDPFTGTITNLVSLDKEVTPEYKFHVTAVDNGSPKHSARTSVIIKIKDYNDSPSLFNSKTYESQVFEDALPGTVILTLDLQDADVDLPLSVEYLILSGDDGSQFAIRNTGELYVTKELDRETVSNYSLDVLVTDGKFADTAKVLITVLDVNDNQPYCVHHRYRKTLLENTLIESFITKILAYDIDEGENSKMRFILTGDGSEDFLLDIEEGNLKTVAQLDRERKSKYSLTAHVQDKEHSEWECVSEIEITILDINDNKPQFSVPYNSVSLPEDAEVGTLITKIHAIDNDIGINKKINYYLSQTPEDHFKILPNTGIVILAKSLDRELQALYNVTIEAVDQGIPQLSSSISLVVNVLDINDNPPEFTRKSYFATVPEINAIGTEVARVLATSNDAGVNADVYYSIIGGNEHRKFAINNLTGVITNVEMLDYERAKEYFLTVQAIDGGIPPLSNVATVNVTVIDCNDNAPIFSQSSYSARVREDAMINDEIIQVTATDLDSGENGKIIYSILKGDNQGQFAINEETGYISVANYLDRETISSYVIEVLAKDNGIPVLSNQVLVNIEISDANDNPPIFARNNYSTVVQEDKPIGHSIMKFVVTDADSPPNTHPYTFDFLSGNEGNFFRLEQDGNLKTATKFNYKIKDTYTLQIRVFDNGTPPLFSDTWVVVKVIEESQYPPVITPLDINVNSYLDDYPGGTIGKVVANDQDQYDTLTFSLAPTAGVNYPAHELFQIDHSDGTLIALPRLDVGEYRVNVTVTDGKFISHTIVKVNVEIITESMIDNSIAIRFKHVSPESFVLSHKKGFIKAVHSIMKCRSKDVIIISVQPSSEDILQDFRTKREIIQRDLDVLFAVKKQTADEFFSADSLRKAMNDNVEELEENTKLVIDEIAGLKCTNSFCVHGVCQDRFVLYAKDIEPISTDVVSFVSPKHHKKIECLCKEGYGGDKCDSIVNECAREPCPVYKLCFPDASVEGYTCQCPEGFAGTNCEVDISRCHDENCYIARNPISFTGKSYSQYRIINKKLIEEELSLSLRIRTTQLTGNLMFAAGIIDYNILEIMNGAVQYRFNLGSGEGVVRVTSHYISDGKWHEIHLERDRNTAKITVDGNYVAQGSAPGINDVLNLQSDEMYLGAEVHQHPSILGFEDVQRGFYGCMDDVRISRVSIPLHQSGDKSIAVLKRLANVKFSCDPNTMLIKQGPCASQPCLNGGTCRETGNAFECKCHARFAGVLCELDTDPCASSPCLHGGKCKAEMGGDFVCNCAPQLTGKRCEYGKYCLPNPCKHGGVCEEGNDGPLCKCRGFSGEFCQFDVDECESSPCQNGGVCHNEIGNFKCVCPPNTSGIYCNVVSRSESIFESLYNIRLEFLVCIGVAGLLFIILIITLCVCVVKLKGKRSQRHQNIINNEMRKDHHNNKPNEMPEVKRGSKLSNLEVNQRDVPVCLPRPLSYTPSSQLESPYICNNHIVLNNLDTLRSYGSAGDELEVPPDYVKNLNSQQNSNGNHTELKNTWAEHMQLASSYEKQKIKNDLKLSSGPNNCDITRLYGGKSNTVPVISKFNGYPAVTSTTPEEDQRSVGSYHWDCSDWARHSQTLPNITEVPGSEVPDSSSFHSNESNESQSHLSQCHYLPSSRSHHRHRVHENHNRDNVDDDMESEECLADSELDGRTASPNLNALNSCNEEFQFTSGSFVRHPNSYLPVHGYNIPSEPEGDCLNSLSPDSDDLEPYGFPSSRLRRPARDDETESVITTLAEERHSLLGAYPSNSDISANLCELEDSDYESEQKPLNYLPIHQTSV